MYFLGIDVGSISTDLVVIDEGCGIKEQLYLKTKGRPLDAIARGLRELGETFDSKEIAKAGVTGSGRSLAGAFVGADVVKNEITTHAAAAAKIDPQVRTVIEIGGQDSKLILLEEGLVSDFAMNTVCAAGTGSFLDRQAERMGIPIEKFGEAALRGKNPAPIAGRCAVFAESDIIHQQQMGVSEENLLAGVCRALVNSYLSNVAQGKKLLPKICFQGGVAANQGLKAAFEEALETEIFVPREHKIMGAYGAALLALERKDAEGTAFKGFDRGRLDVEIRETPCFDCPNQCKVVRLLHEGHAIGAFQDRCGKYQRDTAM
ncbi:acyl-CoA dehydratase activase [Anaerovorax odorimutans]|uniref:Acyl-CoA dehydratase activase n=1 Tax=Anaerovorax odorimutans TaxID=109327 RepID=A0ABT1RTH9_9FIRM|nr:acyl-CoA dehydratase activase [Anaerovorax odorimutans]